MQLSKLFYLLAKNWLYCGSECKYQTSDTQTIFVVTGCHGSTIIKEDLSSTIGTRIWFHWRMESLQISFIHYKSECIFTIRWVTVVPKLKNVTSTQKLTFCICTNQTALQILIWSARYNRLSKMFFWDKTASNFRDSLVLCMIHCERIFFTILLKLHILNT